MPPLITVALPVFNGGATLRLAVTSILSQSFEDWELLLLDDGSTDGAVQALSISDPRLRVVVDGGNLGLSARLNQAASMARGRYFARMDHDDVAHPERLARQVGHLAAHPEIDLLGTQCVVIDEADEVIGELPGELSHEEICSRPWLGFHLPHPTWMGRREWFLAHPYAVPGPYRCEDQELLLRSYQESRYAALPDRLLAYRVRQRIPLATLLHTRAALASVQTRHFLSRARIDFALLTGAAAGLRIAMDLSRSARSMAPGVRPTDILELGAWTETIGRLKERAAG